VKIDDIQVNQLCRVTSGQYVHEVGKVTRINKKKGTAALRIGASIAWFKVEKLEPYHAK